MRKEVNSREKPVNNVYVIVSASNGKARGYTLNYESTVTYGGTNLETGEACVGNHVVRGTCTIPEDGDLNNECLAGEFPCSELTFEGTSMVWSPPK